MEARRGREALERACWHPLGERWLSQTLCLSLGLRGEEGRSGGLGRGVQHLQRLPLLHRLVCGAAMSTTNEQPHWYISRHEPDEDISAEGPYASKAEAIASAP